MTAKLLTSLTIAAGIATLCNPVQAVSLGGIGFNGTFTVTGENGLTPVYTLTAPTSVQAGTGQFATTTAAGISFTGGTLAIGLTNPSGVFPANTSYNFPSIVPTFLSIAATGGPVTVSNLIGSPPNPAPGATRNPGRTSPFSSYTLASTVFDVKYTEPDLSIVNGTISFTFTKTSGGQLLYNVVVEKAANPATSVPEPSAALGVVFLGALGLGSVARNRAK